MPSRTRIGRAPRSDSAAAGLWFAVVLCAVAAGAAGFAIAFRSTLSLVYRAAFGAANVVDAMAHAPRWMRVILPATGGAAAGLIGCWRASRPQGVSNVMEAVALGSVRLSLRTTLSRVMASWSAIAAGMSIGREGPLIEFGGSLGAALARVGGTSLTQTRALVAAGTAAGFAAAYNTPFAAVLFVLETVLGIAALEGLVPVIAATVIATTLTRAIAGGGPIYGQRSFVLESPVHLLSYSALGLIATLVAIAFKATLAFCERVVARRPLPQPWAAALAGALVGLIASELPSVAGNGYEPLNAMLDQRLLPPAIAMLLVAKMVATSVSVASGVPGGIFTPVLLVGGATGMLWAHAMNSIVGGTPMNPGGCALIGMAATTAANIHAPLTAAVLVFELSGDYPIVVPLLLATVVSTALSRGLGSESVYAAELRRRGLRMELTLDGRQTDRL